MGTKHKHYDVIVAWAAGEEIQFKGDWGGPWEDWDKKYAPSFHPEKYAPSFHPDLDWRIKPKRVKKEGWVNVFEGPWFVVHTNEERAHLDKSAVSKKLACIHIEWEEEE